MGGAAASAAAGALLCAAVLAGGTLPPARSGTVTGALPRKWGSLGCRLRLRGGGEGGPETQPAGRTPEEEAEEEALLRKA